METIRTTLQVIIELLIIAFFIPTIIHDLKELRDWAQGNKGGEDPQDPPKNLKENL